MYKKNPYFIPGEIVSHIMHGPEWLGLVLLTDRDIKKTKIHMIPGSEFEFFFNHLVYKCVEQSRVGWIYNRWLIKYWHLILFVLWFDYEKKIIQTFYHRFDIFKWIFILQYVIICIDA